MPFPASIVLEGDILDDFLEISHFFQALDRWEGHKSSYTLNAKKMFDDDQLAWKLFVEIFFPDKVSKLRKLNNGSFSLVPIFHYNDMGEFTLNEVVYTRDDLLTLFDYLLIDPAMQDSVMNYIKDLHFHFQGKPAPPHRFAAPIPRANANNFNDFYNGTNNFANNESEFETNIEIGFKNEEEEEAYGKLKTSNYKRYAPNGGKRKTRKLKKRSA
jgi:hypothetical protein